MKTVLIALAVTGFSVSLAAAECAGHSKVSASIDTETKVASVANQTPAPDAQPVVKTDEQKTE